MNIEKMTDKLSNILMKAIMLAKDNSNPELSSEHIYAVCLKDEDIIEFLSQFNVNAIGRRSMVESNDGYNCVFEPVIPDFVLIENGQPDTEEKRDDYGPGTDYHGIWYAVRRY